MSTTTAPASVLRPPTAEELDPEERMSRAEVESLQLERLQQTVRHAYANVPLYTRKFDEAGVHPDDIRALDDVRLLPFTTKDDLQLAEAVLNARSPKPAEPVARPFDEEAKW